MRALNTLEPRSEWVLLHGLEDADPAVREFAIGAAQQLAPKGQPCSTDTWAALKKLAEQESDPRCQMNLVFSLEHFDHQGRQLPLAEIARRSAGDPWVRAALLATPAPGELFARWRWTAGRPSTRSALRCSRDWPGRLLGGTIAATGRRSWR